MFISELYVKRPVLAVVSAIIVLIFGAIAFFKLDVRGTPKIDFPQISVSANYFGADASFMEKNVATPIEKAVRTINNVDSVYSSSSSGSAYVSISFKLGSNLNEALNDVRSRVSGISGCFPTDMQSPSVTKQDTDAQPSLWLAATSKIYDDTKLTEIIDQSVLPLFSSLSTVGDAKVYGKYRNLFIEPYPEKLYQYKITPIEIENAILAQNRDYPAGILETSSRNFVLKLNASIKQYQDFNEIIIRNEKNNFIKLGDIAKVRLEPNEDYVILKFNGKKMVALGLIKQSDANILDLSKQVRQELKTMKLPAGVDLTIAFDSSIPINASINSIFYTIFESVILVGIVICLFLGHWHLGIIPIIAIPISLIGNFILMYALGFSINTFTLLAMILAIGLVVDDAIVMLENICRHKEQGMSSFQATIQGIKETSFAIVAMTITLSSVFLPIGFMGGMIGKLFTEFAWTLAFCVFISGLVALTITPTLTYQLIGVQMNSNKVSNFVNHYLNQCNNYYQIILNQIFNNKKFVFLALGIIGLLIVISFKYIEKTFIPQEDDGVIQISANGPDGSTLKTTETDMIAIEEVLQKNKYVKDYFEIIGWGGSNTATLFSTLVDYSKRSVSQEQIVNDLNQKFFLIPQMSIYAFGLPSMFSGSSKGKGFKFSLQTTEDFELLDNLSQRLIKRMEAFPQFFNIERDVKTSIPNLNIIINREKAYYYGVSLDSIGRTVQYLIAGKKVGQFQIGNDTYDINLKYALADRDNINSLSAIYIKNLNKSMIPLINISDIKEEVGVQSYNHYNGFKEIEISASLQSNFPLQKAVDTVNNIAKDVLDDTKFQLEFLGEAKHMKESNTSILGTFLLGLVVIYLVLSAQFNNFKDALLILLSVPFSIIGGLALLLITGNKLNLYSNIGLVTLVGLITKNAIMIIEFANQNLEEGKSKLESILTACSQRLRPILMTTAATVLGVVPMIFAHGSGANARISIGLIIFGGMIIGTVFTLLIIPALYYFFKETKSI